MSSSNQSRDFDEATRTIDRIIAAVVERGYDDKRESIDDYSASLETFEQRKLVTFQLYDSYFPPKRHEFELQLLTSLVDAIASSPKAAFLAEAVASGVVGNAAYAAVKYLLTRLAIKTKPIGRTHGVFKEMENNTERIKIFFKRRRQANIVDICNVLGTEPGKIEPLLKLLGFRCRRQGSRRIWLAPSSRGTRHKKTPK